jgi:hypothetical protein
MARHDWPRNHCLMPGPDDESRALTRLGRTVRAVGDYPGRSEPHHREEHRQRNWLRDVILGGQDDLVNILGIIAGGGSKAVLLSAGFAAAITESISTGRSGGRPPCPSGTTTQPSRPARRPR